eukprot:CAMPEP_0176401518 /NCGR_PEP_ID=MMETSP0126-20121128/48498_1 /TAXON_ID=141414 ORGANISM="Strombidinopsis acuminatum, Strain SPMC142" /NCGR_SAMPLE_ID=MMETSP0126 /ASSEMBLY_ACC=CAM_ASM_000229 /LENGTH=57 /DNA_ID=CAMNT_0017778495 /DNA_START=258 /DNA_END=431 /DNA_ORIENTATION=-
MRQSAIQVKEVTSDGSNWSDNQEDDDDINETMDDIHNLESMLSVRTTALKRQIKDST